VSSPEMIDPVYPPTGSTVTMTCVKSMSLRDIHPRSVAICVRSLGWGGVAPFAQSRCVSELDMANLAASGSLPCASQSGTFPSLISPTASPSEAIPTNQGMRERQ
jgi:hypothetical protein